MADTYWNGEPCDARRVRVVVGDPDDPPVLAWWHGLEGTERDAVEVTYLGDIFYLDDDDLPEDHHERQLERLEEQPRIVREKLRALYRRAMELPGFQNRPRAGDGWRKVTEGRGSPSWGHRSLPVERVLYEIIPEIRITFT